MKGIGWCMHIHEGALTGEFALELGQRSTESKLELIEFRKCQHYHPLDSCGWLSPQGKFKFYKTAQESASG